MGRGTNLGLQNGRVVRLPHDLERSNGEQLHQCLYEAASLESISWTGPVRNQPGVEKVGIDLDLITDGGW